MATAPSTRAIGYRERAAFYALEHADTIDQPLLVELARQADGPVLEVPCGSGRNLLLLAASSQKVTGIDLEPQMVGAARATVAGRANVHVDQGDMRSFTLTDRAGLIVVPREAFQLLETQDDALTALRNFRDHLRSGGRLMLDLATFAPGNEREQHLHPSYFDPRTADGRYVCDWVRDLANGQLERWHSQQRAEGSVIISYRYELRERGRPSERAEAEIRLMRLSADQVTRLLGDAGLPEIALYGDYDRHPYENGSPRLIVLATKQGA